MDTTKGKQSFPLILSLSITICPELPAWIYSGNCGTFEESAAVRDVDQCRFGKARGRGATSRDVRLHFQGSQLQGYLKLLPLKLADVKQRKNERRARTALKLTHGALEKSNAVRTAGSSQAIKALEKEVAEHQKAREQISIAYDALNSATSGIIITDANLRI